MIMRGKRDNVPLKESMNLSTRGTDKFFPVTNSLI
jgi:hypothetical protein